MLEYELKMEVRVFSAGEWVEPWIRPDEYVVQIRFEGIGGRDRGYRRTFVAKSAAHAQEMGRDMCKYEFEKHALHVGRELPEKELFRFLDKVYEALQDSRSGVESISMPLDTYFAVDWWAKRTKTRAVERYIENNDIKTLYGVSVNIDNTLNTCEFRMSY